jgi:hypothetical protein
MRRKLQSRQNCGQEGTEPEYILCFPPPKQPEGNAFRQIWHILRWKPEIENQYEYQMQPVTKDIRGSTTVCLFMKCGWKTLKGNRLTQWILHTKMKNHAAKMENCQIHEMKDKQDYPYELRLYLANRFLENISYEKKMKLGILDGPALKRQDLIRMLSRQCDRLNYLTVFTKAPEAYRELAEEVWEQYGLAMIITEHYDALCLCDYVLDCTVTPFHGKNCCKKGCIFFYIWGDFSKLRSLRQTTEGAIIDSCANILDRAFHNKV